MFALGVDLGTTAVKAALYGDRMVATGIADSAAYVELQNPPGAREQDVSKILHALAAATGSISSADLCQTGRVSLADQMHGIVLWRPGKTGDVPCHVSRLVTWEDGRCDAALLTRLNTTLCSAAEAGQGATPLFTGYGVATLVWLLERHPELFEGPAGYTHCGTIGAYVAAVLTGSLHRKPTLHATDAASWGCFSAAKGEWLTDVAAKLHPRLPALLPAVATSSRAVVGVVCAESLVSHGLTHLLPLVAAASPATGTVQPATVTVCIGDHAAVTLATLAALHRPMKPAATPAAASGGAPSPVKPSAAPALPADATVALINLGTSAQACLVGPAVSAALAEGSLSPSSLASGCELRPCVSETGSGSGRDSDAAATPLMLVAASMNGGNVLSYLAGAMHSWTQAVTSHASRTSASASHSVSKDDTYAALEDAAQELLAKGEGPDSWPTVMPLLAPERRPVGWHVLSSDAATAASATADAPAAATGLSIVGLTLQHATSPGYLYAAAAYAVVHNVVSMLPAHMLRRATVVAATGGAVARSAVVRAALCAAVQQHAGVDVPLVFLPADHMAYAGAVGAVLAGATASSR